MWAVRGYTFRFLAPARPGDGALPNSDMRGRDPFPNEMIQPLTQHPRTKHNTHPQSRMMPEMRDAQACTTYSTAHRTTILN